MYLNEIQYLIQKLKLYIYTVVIALCKTNFLKYLFQEVYDWIGAKEELPPHFTLESSRANKSPIKHEEDITYNETINFIERVSLMFIIRQIQVVSLFL